MAKPNQKRILVVDDEPGLRFLLAKGLEKSGYSVDTVGTKGEAKKKLSTVNYFCAFFDINLPDGSGLDLVGETFAQKNGPAVVVMTAEATMKNAIEAIQKGAFDYITKPFDMNGAEELVQRITAYQNSEQRVEEQGEHTSLPLPGELVGRAPAMQRVFKIIGRAADSDATALITGPTGSGKELVAHAFHENSSRAEKPFITVNCAAIPNNLLESELFGHVKGAFTGAIGEKKGKFAQAGSGVILLDEVGETPIELQAKLLRVLQEREFYPVGGTTPVKVDLRILAATNRDLAADVEKGRFREDLYHRLNVVNVKLPSLDERKEDIPLLVSYFLAKIAATFNEPPKRATAEVLETLMKRKWPGNVRELENTTRRAVIMAPGNIISIDYIKDQKRPYKSEAVSGIALSANISQMMDDAPDEKVRDYIIGEVEKIIIEEALSRFGNVQAKAAKALGMNRNTFMKRISELEISVQKSGAIKIE